MTHLIKPICSRQGSKRCDCKAISDSRRLTRPCSRPLRARDRWHFGSLCGALAAADGQSVGRSGKGAWSSHLARLGITRHAWSLGSITLAADAWGVVSHASSLGRCKRTAHACGAVSHAWGVVSHASPLGRFGYVAHAWGAVSSASSLGYLSLAADAWGAVSHAWGVEEDASSLGLFNLGAHASTQCSGKRSGRLSAQPGIAVDRCAREIVGFLNVIWCSALAAPECQAVGRLGNLVG
jgi:hypothetical protein